MQGFDVLDHFAGTGWGVACKTLGLREAGVEIMPAAVATREAAGFTTIYYDVWDGLEDASLVPPHRIYVASPPCQTFSTAGHGRGRDALDRVISLIRSGAYQDASTLRTRGVELGDDRTALVLAPLAHIWGHRPLFVALEQVPSVLPVWEEYAKELAKIGYSVWTGFLNSEDYGVPQTRKRAYLIARRDGKIASAPAASANRKVLSSIRPDQDGLVSNYSHNGATGGIAVPGSKLPRGYRPISEPGFTVTSKITSARWYPSWDKVTLDEAAEMQGYPRGFLFTGAGRLQLGNAVPPPVAEAVLKGFLDG